MNPSKMAVALLKLQDGQDVSVEQFSARLILASGGADIRSRALRMYAERNRGSVTVEHGAERSGKR